MCKLRSCEGVLLFCALDHFASGTRLSLSWVMMNSETKAIRTANNFQEVKESMFVSMREKACEYVCVPMRLPGVMIKKRER